MRATRIPDQLTPLTADEAIEGMRGAVLKLKGREGSPGQVAVLVSQSALETGHWRSIHRFNVGNAKASPDYVGFYCQFRCNEIIDGKTEWFDPPHPQTNFRAFYTAADGFADHIRLLATVNRYAIAWSHAERGNPEAFARAAGAAGYFTANVETYARAVAQLFAKYLPLVREHFAALPTIRVPGFTPPEDNPPLEPPRLDIAERIAGPGLAEALEAAREGTRDERNAHIFGTEPDEPTVLFDPAEEITKTDPPRRP
jgi:Mannosyl-glycoprotein endo-beta-N-acetylglucosaminidase